MVSDYPRAKLSELVTRFGCAICDDPKKCEGLLKDYCTGYRREISALVNVLRSKIIDELLALADGLPQEVLVARLARKLEDDHGLNRELARWAVTSWGIALGRFSEDKSKERDEDEKIKEPRLEREQEARRREAERKRAEEEQHRLHQIRVDDEHRKLDEQKRNFLQQQDRTNDSQAIQDDATRKRKKRMMLGAAITVALVGALIWLWSSSNSVKVQSIQFFAGPDGLAAQVAPTTPPRTNYKSSFRSDEAPFIYYDLRLAQAARTDIALDITWRFPEGSTVSQERSIKAGDLGTVYGRGSRSGPTIWKVGHYVVEFVWHGKNIARAEFDVTPKLAMPPFESPIFGKKYDVPFLQINVFGNMRFYEGPSKPPPFGMRQYRSVFDGRYSRWVWCEINVKNEGDQAPRHFTVTNTIYRNGQELEQWTNDFMTPAPGRNAFYSVSYGSDKMGLPQGTYVIHIFIGNQLIRTGQFRVQ
jgi:hypothetical protein